MDQDFLKRKKNPLLPQGGAPAAPAQLSGGGVPNSAMAEALGGGYQSDMSGLEANMNQRMQAIRHPAAAGVVQQSVPLGTVQMLPGDGQAAPAQEEEEVSFWSHPFLYIRNKWRRYKARKAEEKRRQVKLTRNNKKAWEMTKADFTDHAFNPGDKDEITAIQQGIDEAETPEAAFQALAGEQGRLTFQSDAVRGQLDIPQFKRRMKNMARMVVDYPELKSLVTNMEIVDKDTQTKDLSMAAEMNTTGGEEKITGSKITYVAENGFIPGYDAKEFNGNADYDGNHELGHILNGHLIGLKQQDKGEGYTAPADDWNYGFTSNSLLKKVIRKLFGEKKRVVSKMGTRVNLLPKKQRRIKPRYLNREDRVKKLTEELININGSGFKNDFSANYGRSDSDEFLAEAFTDVYANGAAARKSSIELVKQYERRRDKLKNRIEGRGQKAGI